MMKSAIPATASTIGVRRVTSVTASIVGRTRISGREYPDAFRAPCGGPPGVTADVRIADPGQALARPPGRRAGHLRPRDRGLLGARAGAPERARVDRLRHRPLPVLDHQRVHDPPLRLPLRAREGHRRAPALDHPRGPPRPPERSAAAGHAAVGQRAAERAVLPALLARAAARRRVRRGQRLLRVLPRVRHDALLRPPPHAQVGPGAQTARAAHAASLPGPHQGLRHQRSVVGRGLSHLLQAAQARGPLHRRNACPTRSPLCPTRTTRSSPTSTRRRCASTTTSTTRPTSTRSTPPWRALSGPTARSRTSSPTLVRSPTTSARPCATTAVATTTTACSGSR